MNMYIAGIQKNGTIDHGNRIFAIADWYSKNTAEAERGGLWLYLVKHLKHDRNDNEYYICKPIRCLDPTAEYVCQEEQLLLSTLTSDYMNSASGETDMKKRLLVKRLTKHSGMTIEQLRRDFLSDKISYKEILHWAETRLPVDIAKAVIVPAVPNKDYTSWTRDSLVCGEHDELCFDCRDEDGEAYLWRLTAKTFDKVKHLIPSEYVVRVQENGKLYVSANPDAIICFSKENKEWADQLKPYILDMAANNSIELRMKTRGALVCIKVSRESAPELFQKALDMCGVRTIDGSFAPQQRTSFDILNTRLYYMLLDPNRQVPVRFSNGMTNLYTAKLLCSNKLGMCSNARFIQAERGTIKVCPNM